MGVRNVNASFYWCLNISTKSNDYARQKKIFVHKQMLPFPS